MAIIKPNNNTISAITSLPAVSMVRFCNSISRNLLLLLQLASSSFTDTGLTAQLLPSASSIQILCVVNLQITGKLVTLSELSIRSC